MVREERAEAQPSALAQASRRKSSEGRGRQAEEARRKGCESLSVCSLQQPCLFASWPTLRTALDGDWRGLGAAGWCIR